MTRPSKLLFQNIARPATCFLLFSCRPLKRSKQIVKQYDVSSSSFLSKTFTVRLMSPAFLSDHMKYHKSHLKIPMACLRREFSGHLRMAVSELFSKIFHTDFYVSCSSFRWLPKSQASIIMFLLAIFRDPTHGLYLFEMMMASFACLKNTATRRHVSAEEDVAGKRTIKERLKATY